MQRIFKEVGLGDFKSVNVQILGSEEIYGRQAAKTNNVSGIIQLNYDYNYNSQMQKQSG